MKLLPKFLCGIVLLASANNTFAMPTAYPPAGRVIKLINNTSSSVLPDTTNPNLFYVLPPMSGQAGATGFKANANVGFCNEIADIKNESASVQKRIDKLDMDYIKAEDDKEAKLENANKLELAADKIKTSNSDLIYVSQLQSAKNSNNSKISDDYSKMDSVCSDVDKCNLIFKEIQDLQAQNEKLDTEINDATLKIGNAIQQYNIAKALADEAKDAANNAIKICDEKNTELNEQKSSLMSAYKEYAKLEGGYANISYESGWEQNLQRLKSDNREDEFQYEQTSDAIYYVSLPSGGSGESKENYLSSLPAILDYSVNGVGYVPWGNGNTTQNMPAMSDTLAATLRLSLMGACPIQHPEKFDVKKDSAGSPIFNISAGYNYTTAYRKKITASYNLYKVYQLIKSSGVNSGWFSSSNWTSTLEKTWGSDVFSISWTQEDPTGSQNTTERMKTELEIKNDLMSRALTLMATPAGGANTSVNSFPVPERGGIIVANGLNSICGSFSVFCASTSWILRGIDSLLGSSSSEASFKQTYDIYVSETFDDTIATKVPAYSVIAKSN